MTRPMLGAFVECIAAGVVRDHRAQVAESQVVSPGHRDIRTLDYVLAVFVVKMAVAHKLGYPLTNWRSNSTNSEAFYTTPAPDPRPKSGEQLISDFEISAPEAQTDPSPVMSAAVAEPETEEYAPRVAVDPMMSEPAAASASTSFSDLAEMPPLKEPVYTPPAPEPVDLPSQVVQIYPKKDEKPRIQPREVAEKAMNEISTIPPRLMLFSILGAVGLILVIALCSVFSRPLGGRRFDGGSASDKSSHFKTESSGCRSSGPTN